MTGASIYVTSYMLELILGDPFGGFILLLFWGLAVIFWFEAYVGYRKRTTRKRV